jgi:3'-phosphoadenosine 5'-phosphosulfate sulfotransferase (PAPS reductase)/FAD synthetase
MNIVEYYKNVLCPSYMNLQQLTLTYLKEKGYESFADLHLTNKVIDDIFIDKCKWKVYRPKICRP